MLPCSVYGSFLSVRVCQQKILGDYRSLYSIPLWVPQGCVMTSLSSLLIFSYQERRSSTYSLMTLSTDESQSVALENLQHALQWSRSSYFIHVISPQQKPLNLCQGKTNIQEQVNRISWCRTGKQVTLVAAPCQRVSGAD